MPYKPLGLQLRQMRENLRESLAEVSGAVEIDINDLEQIEAGQVRPDEDILLLLINHFAVQDHQAVKLWELAGYEEPPVEQAERVGKAPQVVIVAVDARTMYTDDVQIHMNDAGLVLQFSQAAGEQTLPISKVGMSYEQAEKVLHNLQASLLKAKYLRGPKRLPQPEGDNATPDQS